MRYFVPDIRLATELSPQFQLEEKLGGIPWGLRPERWPSCVDCGKSQTLLAQFVHDDIRLNLGRTGRSLFVFHCTHSPGMCDSWKAGGRANACFVVEPEDLLQGVTPLPASAALPEREARIAQWRELEDGLTAEEAQVFFDENKWMALDEGRRDELFTKAPLCTRLGGAPHWIQGSREAPGDEWRFVGQLDSDYRFLTQPALGAEGIRTVKLHKDEPNLHYVCTGPNFGDAGIGYIFINLDASPPDGLFFWQCG